MTPPSTNESPSDDAVVDPAQYPAVDVAYDFVLPSYQILSARLEAHITRMQAMMTFAATIMVGFPVLGKAINERIVFWSEPFVGAVILFVALMSVGIVAKDTGTFVLVNPGRLHDTVLHLTPFRFKLHAIYYAGVNFRENNRLITRKANLSRVMSALLLLEVLCFVLWVAR